MESGGDKNSFFVEKVNQQEFIRVLFDHFNSSQVYTDYIRFQKEECAYFLEIKLSKKNKISNIILSQDFPKLELKTLQEKIKKTLVDNQIPQIGQVICFTPYKKVEGYYRYRDLFQLLPIPKDDPQTSFRTANHPCLLQFSFMSCSNPSICSMRIDEKSQQYIRMLSVLLRDRIFTGFTRSGGEGWIQDMANQKGTEKGVRWGMLGYRTRDGFTINMKEFGTTNNLKPIKVISTKKYYSWQSWSGREYLFDPFVLPKNLTKSLDLALNLPKEEFESFFNACTWYDQAEKIWNISHSAAFVSSVIAMECLRDKTKDKYCGKCKQIKNITRNFKEFLSEHVPFINQVPQIKKAIYDIRSNLVHGKNLLLKDIKPWNNIVNPDAMSEFKIEQALLFVITVTALRNWLWKRKDV